MAISYREQTETTRPRGAEEPSVGELLGEITGDLSKLVREEIDLAKAEIRQESSKAGKAAGMFAGSGYAGHLAMLLGSLAAIFGLAHVIDLAWAALVIAAVWAVVAAVLYATGRSRWRTVSLRPELTAETLKEDAQWARHPRS